MGAYVCHYVPFSETSDQAQVHPIDGFGPGLVEWWSGQASTKSNSVFCTMASALPAEGGTYKKECK